MGGRGLILGLVLAVTAAPCTAETVADIVFATRPAQAAYDRDAFGGNPFATALIEILEARLDEDLAFELEVRTGLHSAGQQVADASRLVHDDTLLFNDDTGAVALVMVFADYGDDRELASLPGAAFDAARVAAALERKGVPTRSVVARTADQYRRELADFALRSAGSKRALLYTTGHGIAPAGAVQLLAPDVETTRSGRNAIALEEISGALQATERNLLLYAACRDDLTLEEFLGRAG